MGTADVNGIRIGYDDRGSGPVVVLVHGHPFDRTMWTPQATGLAAAGWRVVVPDLRGYGATTVVPGATPLETFAADIVALLDHLAIDTFVLGGLSMGGQIVLECHRQAAPRIRALLLADTFAQAETASGRAGRYALADRLEREGMAGYVEENLAKMITPEHVRTMPALARHVRTMMASAPVQGAAAALRGRAGRRDYTGELARIGVPTAVVVGRDDEFTPVSDAEYLHERIAGSTLTVIDDAGHLPNLEQPAAFDRAVHDLLARA